MSIDEFIALLEKHAQEAEWRLSALFGAPKQLGIRTVFPRSDLSICDCPLSFLAATRGHDVPACSFLRSAEALGINPDGYNAIFLAADEVPGHDPALRTRLLAAVGLERKET